MQKSWLVIFGMLSICEIAIARTLVDIEAIARCADIADAPSRLECYDASVISAGDLTPRPAPAATTPEKPQIEVSPGNMARWGDNPSLPQQTKLAARVLASPERTLIGGYPIALIDPREQNILPAPQSPLEDFMRNLSDESVIATRYSKDFYFSIPTNPNSSEQAILGFSCQSNITNINIYLAKPMVETTKEVVFRIAGSGTGRIDELIQNERMIEDGYVMEMPRGLEGIKLIKWIEGGNELEIATERNGEAVRLNFNIQSLDQPLSILARQCSWEL